MSEIIDVEVVESNKLELSYSPIKIVSNLDVLEAQVIQDLEPFKDARLDLSNKNNMKEAKALYSSLNKRANELDAARKMKIAEVSAPISELDNKAKALVKLMRDAYRNGKNQMDAAEQSLKEQRRAHLKDEWSGVVGELATLIPFDIIENPSWSNASFGEKKAEKELQDKAEATLQAMESLRSANLEFQSQAMTMFYKTADINQALQENQRLMDEKKEREDYEACAKGLQQRQEEAHKALFEKEQETSIETLPVVTWQCEIEATRDQVVEIAAFIKSKGITGTFKAVQND